MLGSAVKVLDTETCSAEDELLIYHTKKYIFAYISTYAEDAPPLKSTVHGAYESVLLKSSRNICSAKTVLPTNNEIMITNKRT